MIIFAGYIDVIMSQAIQHRVKHNTLTKAKAHAEKVLPIEPQSLVQKYLGGQERPSKQQVVESRKSRFTKPALPVNKEHGPDQNPCECKGKCATKKCSCRADNIICDSQCKCKLGMCKNRE